MAIKDSVESFANETSMPGASKILLNKNRIGRWIWLLTILCAWIMFVVQICAVIQNYFAYQTKVNIEVGYGGVPFPDITVCSNRGWDFFEAYKIAADDKFASHDFFHRWSSLVHNKTVYNESHVREIRNALNSLLDDPASDGNFEELIDKIAFNSSQSVKFISEIHAALEMKDATSVYPSKLTFSFNLFRTSHRSYAMSVFDFNTVAISKEEFIVDCTYNRKRCEDIGHLTQFFHPYYTRCFTYSVNSSRMVQGVQHGWSSILMSGDGMLKSIHGKTPLPLHGLYDMGNAISGKSGARVVLHPPGTRPSPVGKGFDVPPGHALSLGITPKTTTRLGPPYGNCITYPLNESALRGAQNQEECLLMCAQLNTIDLCKCFDSLLPRLTGMKCLEQGDKAVKVTNCTVRLRDEDEATRICECSQGCEGLSFDADRKQSVLDDVACTKQVSSVMKPEECMCPPPCEEYGYDVTYSLTSWPAENSEKDGAFVDIFYKHKYYQRFENSSRSDARRKNNFYKKYVEESGKDVLSDFSRLNVYVEDEEVTKTIETPAMIVSQLLSEIGGQLGVWIGVSIITFAEVIELLVVVGKRLMEKKKKDETDKGEGEELDKINNVTTDDTNPPMAVSV